MLRQLVDFFFLFVGFLQCIALIHANTSLLKEKKVSWVWCPKPRISMGGCVEERRGKWNFWVWVQLGLQSGFQGYTETLSQKKKTKQIYIQPKPKYLNFDESNWLDFRIWLFKREERLKWFSISLLSESTLKFGLSFTMIRKIIREQKMPICGLITVNLF